jgi:MFS family permease
LFAAFAATRMPGQLLGPDGDIVHPPLRHAVGAVGAGIRDGAVHVWQGHPARNALAAIGSHRFFFGISTVSTLLLYRKYAGFTDHGLMKNDLDGLAQIVAASSVGVLLAAALTPAAVRRMGKSMWISWCFALAAATQLTLAATYRQEAYLAAALLLGFSAQGSKICVDTIVQETIHDEFRGRVFAFYDIVFNVAFVAAAALSAALLPPNGKSYAVLAFIAVGYSLTAAAYFHGRRPTRAGGGPPRPARADRPRGAARAGTPAPPR